MPANSLVSPASRRILPRAAVIAFPALALVASCFTGPALAGTVDQVMTLGGTTLAEVPTDGRPSVTGMLIAKGTTKISAQLKIAKGSTLVPLMSVRLPDGTVLDADDLAAQGATVKATTKSIKVSNLPAATSGLYQFLVTGADSSTGAYSLKAKGKGTKGFKAAGTLAAVSEKDDYVLELAENTILNFTVKPGKTTQFGASATLIGPSGTAIDFTPFRTTGSDGSVGAKNFPCPFFGTVTLRVGASVGFGDYTIALKTKASKTPVITPGAPNVNATPETVIAPSKTGTLSATGSSSTFLWEIVSGPSIGVSARTTGTPTVTAPAGRGTWAFQVVTSNTSGYSPPDLVLLDVDNLPVASAGSAISVNVGDPVTLDGSASYDADVSDPMYFTWTQVSGPTATLSGIHEENPTFTPASAGAYVFDLMVHDGTAPSGQDRVVVVAGGAASAADAGRASLVTPMDTVFLSGAGSFGAEGGTPATWSWTRVDSDPAVITLAGANGPVASFSAPKQAARLRFRLQVDGDAATADEVDVQVAPGLINGTPVAKAGGLVEIATEQGFTLDGSQTSDAAFGPLVYQWMQVSGPPTPLSSRTVASPTATAGSSAALLRYILMVRDSRKYSAPDLATVVVGSLGAPLALAGADQSALPGQTMTLGSGGSRVPAGRTIASRRWMQTSGLDFWNIDVKDPGFDPTSASPMITVPTDLSSLTTDRPITLSLFVTDDLGEESLADTITVNFESLPPNAQPTVTANASVVIARPGTAVNLTASGSDGDGDTLSFSWSQIAGPTTVAITGGNTSSASITTPATSGSYTFRVTANDGSGAGNATNTDQVVVSVNLPPVLVVGADPMSAPQGSLVTLSGVGTTDPDDAGGSLTYQWVEINVPATGSPVVLTNANTATATFNVPAYTGSVTQRRRTFRLDVTDALGASFKTSASVQFDPNASPTLNAIIATGDRKVIYNNSDTEALSASPATDSDGDTLTFTWRIVSGPVVNNSYLSSTSGSSVTIRFPAPSGSGSGFVATGGVYTIGVKATDGATQSNEQTITVLAYPSFNTHIYSPILSSGTCSTASCHGGSSAGNLRLNQGTTTTINNLLSGRVTKNDVSSSSLYSNVNNGTMPQSAPKLSAAQIQMIADWIEPDGNGGSSGLSLGAEDN